MSIHQMAALFLVVFLFIFCHGFEVVPPVPDDFEAFKHPDRDFRYNEFLAYTQFHLVKNYTEVGYTLVDIPENVFSQLKAVFDEGMANQLNKEPAIEILLADDQQTRPDLITENTGLWTRIQAELQSAHEAWCGKALRATAAFGLRVYRRGNTLGMHVDRVDTHVISSILHIGSKVDKPWPLHIRNNTGHMTYVNLKPGQMVFYESAKLMHGRPDPFDGEFYSSLFIHYMPTDFTLTTDDVRRNMPKNWDRGTVSAGKKNLGFKSRLTTEL